MTDLIDVCRQVGSRIPHWTQGKGGNVSVKQGGRLWIKASGARMSEVSATHGIACVDLERFGSLRRAGPDAADAEAWYARALIECTTGGVRPSMETGFHALLPAAWVVHFHSLAAIVLAHAHARRPREVVDFLRRHAGRAVTFVPPEIPGWNLSLRLFEHADRDAFVLANHGIVLQGEDPRDIIEQWERVEQAVCHEWGWEALVAFGARLAPHELSGHPFRAYFPDAVVFREAIVEASRGPATAARELRDHADAVEMLEAIVLLEKVCPDLQELDAAHCGAIATLPTEMFRRS